jgi:hypothetical protein
MSLKQFLLILPSFLNSKCYFWMRGTSTAPIIHRSTMHSVCPPHLILMEPVQGETMWETSMEVPAQETTIAGSVQEAPM